MSLKNAGRKRRPCITCGHPEVARINFAIASGGTVSAVARKFGVPLSSLHRHAENHISPEYRAVVQSSPLESEEQLRKLAAESRSISAGPRQFAVSIALRLGGGSVALKTELIVKS